MTKKEYEKRKKRGVTMFEKEAEEYTLNKLVGLEDFDNYQSAYDRYENGVQDAFKYGAEFGYNKANKELILKLKDEGIVKPLKDSIFRNERLSSQEQQELCAWIECAMDFGENLDECAKELEELHKVNEWHYVKDGDLPNTEFGRADVTVAYINAYENPCKRDCCFDGTNFIYWDDRKPVGWKKADIFGKIYAWKYPEKLPELKESR